MFHKIQQQFLLDLEEITIDIGLPLQQFSNIRVRHLSVISKCKEINFHQRIETIKHNKFNKQQR